MKKLGKIIFLYGRIYLLMIVVFISLLTLAAALPHTRKFESLTRRSDRIMNSRGLWPGVNGIALDNVTESQVLNTAFTFDSASPLKSALRSDMYFDQTSPCSCLHKLVNGQKDELRLGNNNRYWMGMSGIMKYLLYYFHIGKIYTLGGIALFIMSVCALLLVYERFGRTEFWALLTLFCLCNFNVFFQSIQFPPVFFVGVGGLLWFCRHDDLNRRKPVFFILGMLTAYLDMLTAPVVAFGIPALIVCGHDMLREEAAGRKDWGVWLRIWFGYPAAWLAGYILSWFTKILLGGWLSGSIKESFAQIVYRVGTSEVGQQFSRLDALIRNVDMLYNGSQMFVFLLVIAAGIVLIRNLIRLKRKEVFFDFRIFAGYLFLAFMPIAVCLMMANHVYIHFWMTYRGLALSCAALMMIHTAFRPLEQPVAESAAGKE